MKTIYIVGSDKEMYRFLAFKLSLDGHVAYVFARPDEALQHMKVRQIRPDVLIAEYSMPEMSGAELHRQMSRRAPALRTIVLSERHVRDLARNLFFMKKSCSPGQVAGFVEAIHCC